MSGIVPTQANWTRTPDRWPPTLAMIRDRWPERSAFTDEERDQRQVEKAEAWNRLGPMQRHLKCATFCRKRGWSLGYIPDFGVRTWIK